MFRQNFIAFIRLINVSIFKILIKKLIKKNVTKKIIKNMTGGKI